MSNKFDVHHVVPNPDVAGTSRALLVLALLPLLGGVLGLVGAAAALMLGGSLAAGAALQAGLVYDGSRRRRRTADELLLAGRSLPPELQWRAEELVGAERMALAGSLRGMLKSLARDVVATSQVVNRPAARAQANRLTTLADRLEQAERPVDARGVLLVRRLLRDGSSPLYDRSRAAELPEQLDTALRALEPRR